MLQRPQTTLLAAENTTGANESQCAVSGARSGKRALRALWRRARRDCPRQKTSTAGRETSITITLDRYGHLMPGNEEAAGELLDAYLERADMAARLDENGDITPATITIFRITGKGREADIPEFYGGADFDPVVRVPPELVRP
jgi:hypothetical protein